ncbi:two-component sensor histidine kinase [Cypionkella aquatica]|uniref:histidine kinase n=1 Tax=Cypionkella aquatica TaxID=1756042 RepID=A0AA37TZW0_9RHOB|nr:ATP-binding protein [Cypionkella aquatica]GLS87162.1 two-component sensor histidine kinase [Cypionkella aquatica]
MQRRLKPFLPRSLFGRAALILVLPVVVVQLIVSIAFIQRHFDGVTRQMTGGVTIELRYLRARMEAVSDAGQAQAVAYDLARGLDLGLTFPLAEADIRQTDSREWFDYAGRAITATLYERLSGVRAVDLTSNPLVVQVYMNTNKGPLRIEIKRSRLSASNPHQLLVWMVFTSALMTFIAYIFLRNQLSPITRLARAAEAFGKGQTMPYSPRGATEVRAAGNAFLNMRARIERQIESRTQMLSGVSHDLRTPLTRLKLGLSFLPEDDDTRALQQDVADMERLVDEFLSFARGDAMEEPESVNLTALMHHIVENARRMGQPVTLAPDSSQPGDALETAKLRPQAITRALENLIGNAVRHAAQVEVSLQRSDRVLRFIVEDDGPGIAKDRRDEALEPFKRLDPARNPNKGGGVGLGLSIASDIARSHGGALRLGESERLGGLRAEISVAR